MNENFRILKPFVRGLPLVILATIIGIMIAKKYLSYVNPMYESTTKLKLADIGEGTPGSNLFKDFDVFATSNKITAEIEVMKSSALLKKTLKHLDFDVEIFRVGDIRTIELYKESPVLISYQITNEKILNKRFKLEVAPNLSYQILTVDNEPMANGTLNSPCKLLGNTILIQTNKILKELKPNIQLADHYEFEILSEEKQINKINKHLDITSVDKDVPIVRINYKSNIPEKASLFVNKLAETYIIDFIENKYQAAKTTVDFLDLQIKDANDKLSKAENSIEEYRNNKSIVNLRQETETDLRKISQLKIQETNLKMNYEAINDLYKYIVNGKNNFLELAPNFEAFTDLLSTEIIKSIKKLQGEKKELLLTYTPGDEKVLLIDQKINDLSSYLTESIKNTRNNLKIKLDEIHREIRMAEEVFVSVPEKEKQMTILSRQFDLMQNSYNFLNEKRIEAEIAQSAKIAFHRVISPATSADKPVSPNRPIIIIVFGILAMLFSIIIIYTIHFMKAKVNDINTIEQNSSIPLAASTPFVKTQPEIVSGRNLIQLELKGLISKGEVLTFSSFDKHEGKTYNLLHICAELLSRNVSLLLIDLQGNMEHLIQKNLKLNPYYKTSHLKIIDQSEKNSITGSSEHIKSLIDSQAIHFDYIFVNNEPISDESRALMMMSLSQHNLVVVDSRITPVKTIIKIEQFKEEYKLPNMWFLLNKFGYNPNVVTDIIKWYQSLLKKRK